MRTQSQRFLQTIYRNLRHTRRLFVFIAAFCSVYPALGQNSAVVGAAYALPTPLTVAPGQLVTVFVSGMGGNLTERVAAATLPLPTTLAGISVSWTQGSEDPVKIPLLAVFPVTTCLGRQVYPCSSLLGITLQVPYEVVVNTPGTSAPSVFSRLVVSDGINTTGAIDLFGTESQVHIARFGDTILPVLPGGVPGPVVTHGDGRVVSLSAPARVGEDLTVYAVGLGLVRQTINTGAPAPSPGAKTSAEFTLAFDYGRNPNILPLSMPNVPPNHVVPSQTIAMGPTQLSGPLPGWLVPGFVGLYQVNFRVPAAPQNVPNCSNSVLSNLSISFLGSSEAAELCVDIGR